MVRGERGCRPGLRLPGRRQASNAFAGFDVQGEIGPEWQQLFSETWASTLRAGEFQKGYAAERSGWAAKGSQFVAVTTVLAVALFLLGLSRTQLGAASGPLLVWSGWAWPGRRRLGLVVLLRPVTPPSARRSMPMWTAGGLRCRALSAGRGGHGGGRGGLHPGAGRPPGLLRCLLRPRPGPGANRPLRGGGPAGLGGCPGGLRAGGGAGSLNHVAWNNLGMARLRLGDADGSVAALRRAVEIRPDDSLANLNLAAVLALSGDDAGYREQLG